PSTDALVNDKSTDLTDFYTHLSNASFKRELLQYADAWENLGELTAFLWRNCGIEFSNYIQGTEVNSRLNTDLEKHLALFLKCQSILTEPKFIVDLILFKEILLASIADKAARIKKISIKETRNFSERELHAHFETGVRSGAYLFFRKLLNQHYNNSRILSKEKSIANWYFVREFCYASMFRYNAKGEFNIPYGGLTYNKKNLRDKVNRIFSSQISDLFKRTTISNKDFESFLGEIKLTERDFIFVDPPYDSEFSEYDQNAFTSKDQERLALLLKTTKARWMVVIKETELIRQLYSDPKIKIETFAKKYAYNVRGRNDRAVSHLIITNY
ncbi:MAG: DNA adenine methylase, partial [Bacteroidia bacterium]